jgi:hypothetical protein
MIRRTGALFLVGFLCVPGVAKAHHSVTASFDTANIVELEGEITDVRWQNPHVRFTVEATGENGDTQRWDIESASVSILRRMDLSRDVLGVGQRVRVAGNPARRGGNGLYALNLLLPDTQEVLLSPGSVQRWATDTIGSSDTWHAEAGDASDPSRGIFRVWSTRISPENRLQNTSYPLTAAARAAADAYDPVGDSPILNCAPKGMPTIMTQPYPIEFVEQDDAIRLRIEEYDLVRTIHLDAEARRAAPPSDLGYSIGRWDGRTLEVTTTDITWTYFDHAIGIPQSDAVGLVERFTPSVDGSRLDYMLTVTDAVTFTQPVVMEKYWLSIPGVRVEPYDCTVSQ